MPYNSNKQTFACSNFGSSVPKNKIDKIRVFLGTPFDEYAGGNRCNVLITTVQCYGGDDEMVVVKDFR